MQHGSDRLWLPLQVPAQPLGHREHPLAHRQGWEDVIDQVGSGLRHAPGVAGRANAAPLAGEGHQEIVAALPTTRPRTTAGKDAAFQVPAKLPLRVGRDRMTVPILVPRERQVGLQVLLEEPVEDGLLGTATGVGGGSAPRGNDGHGGARVAVTCSH